MNSDICGLTVLESYLRGIEMKETFINRIISPIYTIDNKSIWIITIILLITSINKLLKNDEFILTLKNFKNIENYDIKNILNALKPLIKRK